MNVLFEISLLSTLSVVHGRVAVSFTKCRLKRGYHTYHRKTIVSIWLNCHFWLLKRLVNVSNPATSNGVIC